MRLRHVYIQENKERYDYTKRVVATSFNSAWDDIYLTIKGRAESQESLTCLNALLAEVKALEQGRYRAGKGRIDAIGALIYDLLSIKALGGEQFGFISLRASSFTGKPIGYRAFISTFKGLSRNGYLEFQPGFLNRHMGTGEATRMRASTKLLAFLLQHGITPSNYQTHFRVIDSRLAAVADPIRVRAPNNRDFWKPEKGALLPVDYTDPVVNKMADQVQRLNAFFAKQQIGGCTFDGLYRLFNQGTKTGYGFNKGGRLYVIGNFQRMQKEPTKDDPTIRADVIINGEATCEVDVSGSHLTLLHARLGVPLPDVDDLYAVAGVANRTVVKMFVTMTIGNGKFQRQWGREAKLRYLKRELGIDKKTADYTKAELGRLQADYPIAMVRKAVLSHLPILKDWPGCPVTWADLQYQESLGLIATIETLAFEHGVPAFPLHDSVVVPESKGALAKQVMIDAFKNHANVDIQVKTK